MERLPDAELARRAAGGDGSAFVRLYDRYSAEIFENVLAATASVETASAATQSAFLNLLGRPPAMGAPDSEVRERLRALALGAGVQGATLRRPVMAGAAADTGAGVGWLRTDTVALAGERFDEDWGEHLGLKAAEPPPPNNSAPAPSQRPPAPRPRVVSEMPLAPAPPPPRRSFVAVLEDLPLQAAGAAAILLALVTAGAAALTSGGLSSEDRSADTSRAAEKRGADQGDARYDVPARARRGARRRAVARRGPGDFTLSNLALGSSPAQPGQRGSARHTSAGRPGLQQVAGRRRASAPLPGGSGGGGGPLVGAPRRQSSPGAAPSPTPTGPSSPEPQQAPAQAPAPEPTPAPAPAPAPETAEPSKPEPNRGSSRNCHADKTC